MPTIDPAKASLIARDILNSISIIDKQLKTLESLSALSYDSIAIFKKIEEELSVLWKKTCDHFAQSKEAHRAAFELQFTYPSRFKTHAPLEYILTYIYLMVDALQQGPLTMHNFFVDADHWFYATNLINGNKAKVKPYVKMS